MRKISEHISWREAVNSRTAKKYGIENIFTQAQLIRMMELAEKVFEPVREYYGVPIYISSFFRSEELNEKIGGSNTSQHMANNGAAIDLDADVYDKITNLDIFNYILNNLEYDQLIAEAVDSKGVGWVHVSYNEDSNRKQPLIMYIKDGKQVYEYYTKELLNSLMF